MEALAERKNKLATLVADEEKTLRDTYSGPISNSANRVNRVQPPQDTAPETAPRMNDALNRLVAAVKLVRPRSGKEMLDQERGLPPGGGRPGPGPGGHGPGEHGGAHRPPFTPPDRPTPGGGPPSRPGRQ